MTYKIVKIIICQLYPRESRIAKLNIPTYFFVAFILQREILYIIEIRTNLIY